MFLSIGGIYVIFDTSSNLNRAQYVRIRLICAFVNIMIITLAYFYTYFEHVRCIQYQKINVLSAYDIRCALGVKSNALTAWAVENKNAGKEMGNGT